MDIPIKATNVPVGEYELVVTGKSASENYSYTDTAIVKVEVSENLVFIQSDKPIYKPGQTGKPIYKQSDKPIYKPGQTGKAAVR